MTQFAAIVRGLLFRGGSTLMIFAVALVAVAAATMGPAYYEVSKTSILLDTVTAAPVSARGFEVVQTGAVSALLSTLVPQVQGELAGDLGGQATARRLFAPPLTSLELQAVPAHGQTEILLAWRDGQCAHLRISGQCPSARNQVIISASLARSSGWRVGQRVPFTGWGTLAVTGIYQPPDASKDYWFGSGTKYFPYEYPSSNGANPVASAYDAMFTPQATLTSAPSSAQGTATVDDLLIAQHLRGTDVPALLAGMNALLNSPVLTAQQANVQSAIPATLTSVQSSWASLAVPVALITAQLLVLTWLLLFLTVTDAVEVRGPEVALAKLRGQGRVRTITFGLSEPVTLLLLALPLGVLAGWGATAALAGVLLRPLPVGLPPPGWAAAAVATVGGLVAVALAARKTLSRPVAEQWRRAGRRATDRGWVVDAILLSGAAAGLLDLAVTGEIGSARRSVLVLLVPGLLGLAVAVIASRVLPLACRASFARTRRRGGIGRYLALRHVARRPGGIRTTIVLATSFALAAFAVTAWSVSSGNYRLAASTQVGAPAVLTVAVPQGKDLAAIVARADPGGRMAAAVDEYTNLSGAGAAGVVLGVDPQRFARIAAWRPSFAAQPLTALAAKLAPPAPPPVVVTGDAMRATVTVHTLTPAGIELWADVNVNGATVPIDLGALPAAGTVTRAAALVGCPCMLLDLRLSEVPIPSQAMQGSVVFAGLQARRGAAWSPVDAGFGDASRWRPAVAHQPPDVLSAGPGGLTVQFAAPSRQDETIAVVDRPIPLPAIAAAPLTNGATGHFTGIGLDGNALPINVIAAAAAVPGAPAGGLILDRRYAELAANDNMPQVNEQVWLAAGAQGVITARLAAAGVRVLSVQTTAAQAALLSRQGPGLASVLFLADAAAAALLAAGAAILALYLSARRRRYEYAALAATGVARRTLRGALLTEQLIVLGFGTLVGICAGLGAAFLVIRSVPEFITQPSAPPLVYVPAAGPLAALLGVAVGVLAVAAVTASGTLAHGVDLDQLREAPA